MASLIFCPFPIASAGIVAMIFGSVAAQADTAAYLNSGLLTGLGARVEGDFTLPFLVGVSAYSQLWGDYLTQIGDRRNRAEGSQYFLSGTFPLTQELDYWFVGPAVGYMSARSLNYLKAPDSEKEKSPDGYRVESKYSGPVVQFTGGKRWAWENGFAIRASMGAGWWFRNGHLSISENMPASDRRTFRIADGLSQIGFSSEVAMGYIF